MRPPSSPRDQRILRAILGAYLAAAVVIAVQRTILSRENNFYIFRAAWEHLRSGADLYAAYPQLHSDFFKYSPTFALLFAPFAVLPPTAGYALWAAVSAFTVWYGVTRVLPPRAASLALVIAALGVVGDLQRAQSNTVVTGLMILSWAWLERDRQLPAAAAVAAGAFVKLFPLAAGMGALLHRRWLRFGLILIAVIAVGAALPLVATSADALRHQYASWYAIESTDAVPQGRYGTAAAGLYAGLMGLVRAWFGVDWPHWPMQLAGLVVVLLPLVHRARYAERAFRLHLLGSLLVFCVLFNHQAESPSYSIAMTGASLWFAAAAPARWRTALLVACYAMVNLGSTDLMPKALAQAYYVPYMLKTVMLVPLWIVMQLELHGVIANAGASELAEMDEPHVAGAEAVAHGG
jgi:hypothetical protein